MPESRDDVLRAASIELARQVRHVKKRNDLTPLEVLFLLHSLTGASVQSFLAAERSVIRGPRSGKPGDIS